MSGAHEALEHAEHTAHAGHGGHAAHHEDKGHGRQIGITMAMLGVLLAICAALVGSERTEFIATVVEQANVNTDYQASSTKYRMGISALRELYSSTPTLEEIAAMDKELDALPMKPESNELSVLVKTATRKLVGIVTPDVTDIQGIIDLIDRYREEGLAARAWSRSFTPIANAHYHASESFEKAQVAAEIGIVLASIALLMASRMFWFASIASGGLSLALILSTFLGLSGTLHKKCDPSAPIAWEVSNGGAADAKGCLPGAEQRKAHAEEEYDEIRNKRDEKTGKRIADIQDEQLVEEVKVRFGILHAEPAKH
jgi:hypothetical protein